MTQPEDWSSADGAEPILLLRVDAEAWGEAIAAPGRVAEAAARAALEAAGLAAEACEISLLLTDDAAIATLNERFRDKPGATNVLSWPAFTLDKPLDAPMLTALAEHEEGARAFLGDLALALETIRIEAKNERKRLEAHFAHLIVHGVLHLVGYDHETEREAWAMEARERAALASIGVSDPYAEGEDAEDHGDETLGAGRQTV